MCSMSGSISMHTARRAADLLKLWMSTLSCLLHTVKCTVSAHHLVMVMVASGSYALDGATAVAAAADMPT